MNDRGKMDRGETWLTASRQRWSRIERLPFKMEYLPRYMAHCPDQRGGFDTLRYGHY